MQNIGGKITFNDFINGVKDPSYSPVQNNPNAPKLTTLQEDKIEIQGKEEKKNKNLKPLWITLGVLAAGAVGIATATVIGGVHKCAKANLRKDMAEMFKNVFLNENITQEEAEKMLLRYKAIEKIKDKKEYIKALFDEACKNYGLDKDGIKLVISDKKLKGTLGKLNGKWDSANKVVSISSKCRRGKICNTMHHELRHALQSKASGTIGKKSDEYIEDIVNIFINHGIKIKNGAKLTDEDLMKACRDYLKGKVPNNYLVLGAKNIYSKVQFCANEFFQNTNSGEIYLTDIIEKDARWAGNTVENIVKQKNLKLLRSNWFEKQVNKIDYSPTARIIKYLEENPNNDFFKS